MRFAGFPSKSFGYLFLLLYLFICMKHYLLLVHSLLEVNISCSGLFSFPLVLISFHFSNSTHNFVHFGPDFAKLLLVDFFLVLVNLWPVVPEPWITNLRIPQFKVCFSCVYIASSIKIVSQTQQSRSLSTSPVTHNFDESFVSVFFSQVFRHVVNIQVLSVFD